MTGTIAGASHPAIVLVATKDQDSDQDLDQDSIRK